MDEREALVRLRNALAPLYADEISIRRIAHDAGLEEYRISFSGQAVNTWHAVLQEAKKNRKIEQVISIALMDYHRNEELREAADIYEEVILAEKDSKEAPNVTVQGQLTSSDNLPTTNAYLSPIRCIRECLEKAYTQDSLRIFCQDHFPFVYRRFHKNISFDEMIAAIIDFCHSNNEEEWFWEVIKPEHPLFYDEYYPRWKKALEYAHNWNDYRFFPNNLITDQNLNFYSCFISYSSKDKAFVERLYADLQNKGVRCWYAPEDLKIGEPFLLGIDQGIRLQDKLLLVLSEESVNSSWVQHEVLAAMAKEQGKAPWVLFPIRLDDAVMETSVPWANMIRQSRHIGDFSSWKDHDSYRKSFDKLLRDLKGKQ